MDHMWGDVDFDWNMLDDAMHHIYKVARDEIGLQLIMKEKYGTIRYEMIYMWADAGTPTDMQMESFLCLLWEATIIYPKVAAEIVEDMYYNLEDEAVFSKYLVMFKEILDEAN